MGRNDRRRFIQLMGSGALASALPPGIARALELPANNRTGTIADVEHIVILMQENRSFDHYFGTLRGVRGFSDPRAVNLPSGNPVWYQPDGAGYVLPFHPSAPNLGLQFLQDTPHDWNGTHAAWNGANYDQWVPNKGVVTMAYLTRNDIPYHYALADAFTVCDAYHCSLMGPTDPNRYHMWTGWVGNDGTGGGPVIDNAEVGYDWSTFPERLQQAGITWKIYQDVGTGLDAGGYWGWTSDPYIGNYGDNSLLYFQQYQNAQPGTPLADYAKTGTNISVSGTLFDTFREDVRTGKLPQVSWIVAPEAYTEHGNWPPNYGAWYVSQFIDALTSNPEVWSKTALFLVYDENDGFFDHVVPPTPPQTRAQGLSTVSTVNEIFPGNSTYGAGPYGFGVRVPMIVISPWSKGGWVNSQVFDHTSLIRFIEARFAAQYPGLRENNITPWRRAVAGDLTSAFDFATPNATKIPLPSTVAYLPPDRLRHPSYSPLPPAVQSLPVQEPGIRPSRALPYELHAHGSLHASDRAFHIDFANTGEAAAVFQVRSGSASDAPRTYTVEPGKRLADTWNVGAGAAATYDLSVYGPNGFLRAFKGSVSANGASALDVTTRYDRQNNGIFLDIANLSGHAVAVKVQDRYSGEATGPELAPHGRVTQHWSLDANFGWYDLLVSAGGDPAFAVRLAGHVETGEDSASDPAIGALPRD